ncbi:hypothetical protein G9A89_003123 [Geosiphon pyriformis]|nr:hypothetical protein G9A89_003123 [Geosiphon pyriformis]
MDKGKILAYMKTINLAKIAKMLGCDCTTIRRFIDKPQILTNHEKDFLVCKAKEKRHPP